MESMGALNDDVMNPNFYLLPIFLALGFDDVKPPLAAALLDLTYLGLLQDCSLPLRTQSQRPLFTTRVLIHQEEVDDCFIWLFI